MKGVEFPQMNAVLGRPGSMKETECYDLPIRRHVTNLGPAIASVWELTDEDIDRIIVSRKIFVNTMGTSLAPFSLDTEDPFPRRRVLLRNPDGLIGDFLGTIPAMIDVARIHQLDVVIHPEARELFDLIPKRYGITAIDEPGSNDGYDYHGTMDISAAFTLSHQKDYYMSQAHMELLGLWVSPQPPKAELDIPDIDVPVADFILAPFSRSLPSEQKWPAAQWQKLVDMHPDKTFVVIGHDRDPRRFITGRNVLDAYAQPITEVCNLLKKARRGLISVVSGPSHLAFHLGVKNYLLTNQNMTWGNNPDAIQLRHQIPNMTAEDFSTFLDA
ncbi:glycosyltransferase family 9 protein [Flavihumibacter petaseus]|uniref:Glycosyltransferase n=1 Tax=Flavihumibacter petaseus NBRC 106054 TaxID=1220578 RepID=A0A0E9N1Q5_9BACT|nr:hypothetical protein [Flavihumibacter petaseus]GAO43784.1 hypothetical protein FPE01S_02_08900 [Flavihumibacter petaseus NBRC 106054]